MVIDKRAKLVDGIDFGPDCWNWTGYLDPQGYGRLYGGEGTALVHRQVWEGYVGPIPDGLVLDHPCRNPTCCNPDHLEVVDQRTNILRGEGACAQHARKAHCVNGHDFAPENTGLTPDGRRYCKACVRASYWRNRDGINERRRERRSQQKAAL